MACARLLAATGGPILDGGAWQAAVD